MEKIITVIQHDRSQRKSEVDNFGPEFPQFAIEDDDVVEVSIDDMTDDVIDDSDVQVI